MSLTTEPLADCEASMPDLVFIVDGSTEVGEENFRRELDFVKVMTSMDLTTRADPWWCHPLLLAVF